MSPTENPSSASLAADPADISNLFTAFQKEDRKSRGRWALALVAVLIPVAVLVAGIWTFVQEDATTFRVVTPHGFKSVRGGMTTDQVVALLGRPMTRELDATGADCYRYGTPSMEKDFFLVYAVCYESGKLRDVKQQKYSAWSVVPEAEGGGQVPARDAAPVPAGAPEAASSSTAGSP